MVRNQFVAVKLNRWASWLLIVALAVGGQSFLAEATAAESQTTVGNYIVVMKEQIDIGELATMSDLDKRRWAIYRALRKSAEESQSGLLGFLQQEQLAGRVSKVNTLWNVNAVAFTGQAGVAQAIGTRSDVLSVSVDELIDLPTTDVSRNHPDYWNLDQIKASGTEGAWTLGYSGAGATRPVWVGSIDTGVDVRHPRLNRQFRGTFAPGQFDANYNWIDFLSPSNIPFDPNGHGTHVMGTILGGDGPGPGAEDPGIAYNAKWMSARAFDQTGRGLTSTVLRATQWMQAPTTLNPIDGQPPLGRPDLAPDIINNSWSTTGGCRIWWKIVVDRWVSANIVPMFSIGDEADPQSGSVHSPGDLRSSQGIGATDLGDGGADEPASFSAQGPASCDLDSPPTLSLKKPDVSAPGISIRSTSPGGGYAYKDGTSMATAHATGVAALMLDAYGQQRSVTGTLTDLNNSADRPWVTQSVDDVCEPGEKRNDLGCGRINALRAVILARRSGSLNGHVKDPAGVPIEGARVSVVPVQDPAAPAKIAVTNPAGFFSIPHLKGDYEVSVRAWGFLTTSTANGCSTCRVDVPDNTTVSRDFTLQVAPRVDVTGVVRRYASGDAAGQGITVKILDAPPCTPGACFETTTGTNGAYLLQQVPVTSPGETYEMSASGDRCALDHAQAVVVSQPSVPIDIVRPLRRDRFGYFCVEQPAPWMPARSLVDMHGDDVAESLPIGFEFPFYNSKYSTAHVSSNGFLRFGDASTEYMNDRIPSEARPNNAIYPFWDDLSMGSSSKILKTASSDFFTVEWRDMVFYSNIEQRVTFSVTLHRNGDIEFKYRQPLHLVAQGAAATIGIEDVYGDDGFQYSLNEPVVKDGIEILWSRAVAPGVLNGTVSGPSGPISLAEVKADVSSTLTRRTFTNPDGSYRHWLNGSQGGITYTATASAFAHEPKTQSGTVRVGIATLLNFPLTDVPVYKVSGVVTDSSNLPVKGIPVTIGDPNIPDVTTDGNGYYEFPRVPAGTYTITSSGSKRCRVGIPRTVEISGPTTVDLKASHKTDSYGYICNDDNPLQWEAGLLPILLTGDERASVVELQFAFPFYSSAAHNVSIGTNGVLALAGSSNPPANAPLASDGSPNFALFPFWDDLKVDEGSQVLTKSEPSRFVVEYRNVLVYSGYGPRLSFQVILDSSGAFQFQYKDVEMRDLAMGSSATIGIEDGTGRIAFPYSFNEPAVSSGLRIEFSVPVRGILGRITDASTALPLPGAKITVSDGTRSTETMSGTDGVYRVRVEAGTYSVTAARFGYITQRVTGTVVPSEGSVRTDFALSPAPLRIIQGTAFDLTGRLLPGISVEITHVDTGTVAGTVMTKGYGLNLATYGAELPEGTYDFRYPGVGYCMTGFIRPPAVRITIPSAPASYNLTFPIRRDDGYGFTCRERTAFLTKGIRQAPVIPGTNGSFALVTLPFEFPIYGEGATTAYVSPNGWLQFDRGAAIDLKGTTKVTDIDGIGIQGVPGPRAGARIDVFNTVSPAEGASIFFGPQDSCFPLGCSGVNPDPAPEEFVIEWRNLRLPNSEVVSFSVVLKSDGSFEALYQGGVSALSSGRQATIEVQDPCGESTFTYFMPSFDQSNSGGLGPIRPNTGVWFFPPFVGDVDPAYSACPA